MKKQISIASALVAASGFSHGEIKVNEYLSFEGFVAADYAVADSGQELNGVDQGDESDNFFGVPEVEIDWLFNFGRVGGRVDLQHEDQFDGDFVEQAFMTYELWDDSTLTAGRYASMLAYEDFERPGLHQYSTAYDLQLTQVGAPQFASSVGITPAYNQGLKYTYESNGNFFGVSVQDSVFNIENDRFGGDLDGVDTGTYGIEAAGALQLAEGLRWFLGGAYEDVDAVDAESNYVLNTYLAYESGPWTFGAELNFGESENGVFALNDLGGLYGLGAIADEEVVQGMIVANYAYSDCSSVTGRISFSDHSGDDGAGYKVNGDAMKYTLAHKIAFSDNLALINEVSYVDGDVSDNNDNDGEFDSTIAAASLLFTF